MLCFDLISTSGVDAPDITALSTFSRSKLSSKPLICESLKLLMSYSCTTSVSSVFRLLCISGLNCNLWQLPSIELLKSISFRFSPVRGCFFLVSLVCCTILVSFLCYFSLCSNCCMAFIPLMMLLVRAESKSDSLPLAESLLRVVATWTLTICWPCTFRRSKSSGNPRMVMSS